MTVSQKDLADAASKVAFARYQMIQETPFFGIVSSNLKIMPVPEHLRNVIKLACVTPTGICMYNPDFVNAISFEAVKGLLAHEALHPALNYWDRFEGKDMDIANTAHDFAINALIVEEKTMKLPDGGLYDIKYKNLSAEEIYYILEQKSENSHTNYTLKGDVDKDLSEQIEKEYFQESRGKEITEEDLKEIRQKASQSWKDTLQSAIIEERNSGRGSLPSWLMTEIEGILFPKLNFKGMLKRFFGKFGQPARPSFKHRNKRNTFMPNMFIKPKMVKSLPKIYVLIDTSGSMWEENGYTLVKGAMGLIKRLATNDQYDISIIMADTGVKEEMNINDVMQAIKNKTLVLKGGGGSCFISAFERIWALAATENNGQAPILCITDGHITVPDAEARLATSTAWITPPDVNPPTTKWGKHMEMRFD